MANVIELRLAVRDDGTAVIEEFSRDTERALGKTETQAKKATVSLEKIGSAATTAGVALAAFGGVGAFAFGQGASELVAFERELSAVNTLLSEDSTASIEEIRDQVFQLGSELGSVSEITNATYQAISASIPAADAVGFVADAARLAAAGMTDTTTAVDVLTTALNAYGLEATSAGQISDILFQTVKAGKTTADELGASLGNVIPTAANLGVSFTDVSAAVAELTKVGLNTPTAVTSLNAALGTLLKPSSQAAELAEELKIDLGALRDELSEPGGLINVLGKLADATAGNDEAMAVFFSNVRAQRAVFSLTGDRIDAVRESMAQFTAATERGGQTAEAFAKRLEDPSLQLEAMKNATERARIALVEGFASSALGVVGTIRQLAEGFSSLTQESRELVAEITLAGTAVSLFAGSSLILLGRLPALIQGFQALQSITVFTVGAQGALTLGAGASAAALAALAVAAAGLAVYMTKLSVDINETVAQNARLLDQMGQMPQDLGGAVNAFNGLVLELGRTTDEIGRLERQLDALPLGRNRGRAEELRAEIERLRDREESLRGSIDRANDSMEEAVQRNKDYYDAAKGAAAIAAAQAAAFERATAELDKAMTGLGAATRDTRDALREAATAAAVAQYEQLQEQIRGTTQSQEELTDRLETAKIRHEAALGRITELWEAAGGAARQTAEEVAKAAAALQTAQTDQLRAALEDAKDALEKASSSDRQAALQRALEASAALYAELGEQAVKASLSVEEAEIRRALAARDAARSEDELRAASKRAGEQAKKQTVEVKKLTEAVETLQSVTKEAGERGAEDLVGGFAAVLSGRQVDVAELVGDTFQTAFETGMEKALGDRFQDTLADLIEDSIQGPLETIDDALLAPLQDGFERTLANLSEPLLTAMNDLLEGVLRPLEDVVQSLFTEILDPVTGALGSALSDLLEPTTSAIGDLMSGAIEAASGVISGAFEAVVSDAAASAGAEGGASLASSLVSVIGSTGWYGVIAAAVVGLGVGIASLFGAFGGRDEDDLANAMGFKITRILRKALATQEVQDAVDEGLGNALEALDLEGEISLQGLSVDVFSELVRQGSILRQDLQHEVLNLFTTFDLAVDFPGLWRRQLQGMGDGFIGEVREQLSEFRSPAERRAFWERVAAGEFGEAAAAFSQFFTADQFAELFSDSRRGGVIGVEVAIPILFGIEGRGDTAQVLEDLPRIMAELGPAALAAGQGIAQASDAMGERLAAASVSAATGVIFALDRMGFTADQAIVVADELAASLGQDSSLSAAIGEIVGLAENFDNGMTNVTQNVKDRLQDLGIQGVGTQQDLMGLFRASGLSAQDFARIVAASFDPNTIAQYPEIFEQITQAVEGSSPAIRSTGRALDQTLESFENLRGAGPDVIRLLAEDVAGSFDELWASIVENGSVTETELRTIFERIAQVGQDAPELLPGAGQAIQDILAELQVATGTPLDELIAQFDPDLSAAVDQALLAVEGLNAGLGNLTDAATRSVDAILADFDRFGTGSEARTQILNRQIRETFQQMFDGITEDGGLTASELEGFFSQVNRILALSGDQLSDATRQDLMELIAELEIITDRTATQIQENFDAAATASEETTSQIQNGLDGLGESEGLNGAAEGAARLSEGLQTSASGADLVNQILGQIQTQTDASGEAVTGLFDAAAGSAVSLEGTLEDLQGALNANGAAPAEFAAAFASAERAVGNEARDMTDSVEDVTAAQVALEESILEVRDSVIELGLQLEETLGAARLELDDTTDAVTALLEEVESVANPDWTVRIGVDVERGALDTLLDDLVRLRLLQGEGEGPPPPPGGDDKTTSDFQTFGLEEFPSDPNTSSAREIGAAILDALTGSGEFRVLRVTETDAQALETALWVHTKERIRRGDVQDADGRGLNLTELD